MGLDNIPKQYPCKTQGTAILDDEDRIDCKATQEQNGCPYLTDFAKSGLGGGAVYGMFGTDCWYRGKYGNYLLEASTVGDTMGDELNFYGDEDDGTVKTPKSCVATADLCREAWQSYKDEEIAGDEEIAEIVAGLKYAEWYLRWAAETTDGLSCWY